MGGTALRRAGKGGRVFAITFDPNFARPRHSSFPDGPLAHRVSPQRLPAPSARRLFSVDCLSRYTLQFSWKDLCSTSVHNGRNIARRGRWPFIPRRPRLNPTTQLLKLVPLPTGSAGPHNSSANKRESEKPHQKKQRKASRDFPRRRATWSCPRLSPGTRARGPRAARDTPRVRELRPRCGPTLKHPGPSRVSWKELQSSSRRLPVPGVIQDLGLLALLLAAPPADYGLCPVAMERVAQRDSRERRQGHILAYLLCSARLHLRYLFSARTSSFYSVFYSVTCPSTEIGLATY